MNRDPQNREGQKDPIFLLQRRDYILTHCPDWLGYDGDSFWIDHSCLGHVDTSNWNFLPNNDDEIDERKLFEYLCDYTDDDYTAAIETWHTESVWLTRYEAERFAKATEYRCQFGWRVYCISACGELAETLNKAESSLPIAV